MHERCVNSLNISTSIQQRSTSTLACIVRTLRDCFSIRAIVIMIVIMEALKTGSRISLLCRRWISDTKTCSSSCYHPLHKLVSGWQIIRCFHCPSISSSFYSIDSNLYKFTHTARRRWWNLRYSSDDTWQASLAWVILPYATFIASFVNKWRIINNNT